MLICPICKTEYEDSDEFCRTHGARLVPAGGVVDKPSDTSKGRTRESDTSVTDESLRRELRQLRDNLTQRDARITELEEQLAAARRELKKLQEAATKAPRLAAAAEEKTKGKTKSGVGKIVPESVESSLQDTDVVTSPEGTFGWLICVAGPQVGERFAITAEGVTIGRKKQYAEAGGISISNQNVSNPHAWVGVERDKVVIKDDGSTNGTFLNDPESEPIKKAVLEIGDTIIVANNVAQFVFRK
jgi:hypothetical protein